MKDNLNLILSDMYDQCARYGAIGAGHAAQPIRNFAKRIEAVGFEDTKWRFELCERLGVTCEAGGQWTVDEMLEFIDYMVRMQVCPST